MKKRTLALAALSLTAFMLIAACGAQSVQAAGIPLTNRTFDLIYATNTPGTGQYTIAAAQAAIVTSQSGGRVNIMVLPCASSEGISAAYASGQANIGQQAYGTMMQVWPDSGNPPANVMRAVAGGSTLPFTFIANRDSGIETVADLVGKRVTYVSPNLVNRISAESILYAFDIDPTTDIRALPMSDAQGAMNDLIDGRTDAIITSISGAKMTDLASKINPIALQVPPELKQKAIDFSENYLVGIYMTREFPGVPAGANYVGTLQQLNAKLEVDDEAVYLMTKILMEGFDELSQVAPDLREWSPQAAIRPDVGFPYHAGAVAYYKEAGMWTPEIDAWQTQTLARLGVEK